MGKSIKQAEQVVRTAMGLIYTVQEWAEAMDFRSTKQFSRTFRNHFGARPKTRLIELRVEKFFDLLKETPEMSCYEIAVNLGLRDEIALSKFIKRHTGKSPTKWKNGKKE